MDNVEKTEMTVAEKLVLLEKEKFTRRQALVRFGFQAGAAAVAALTADELLREVGKEMQRRAGDSKVAQEVAKEFEKAGIANAAAIAVPACGCNLTGSGTSWWKCITCESNSASLWPALNCSSGNNCMNCCHEQYVACMQAYANNPNAPDICQAKRDNCEAEICD